ncbi:UPF0158 family protein [Pseudomonas sp. LRF_L74]|uniref:UPF0158 family protein n=1 Tax=Pseudomonas sp. LRF_L74 TaxID=3369422 RepID=UPI003F5E909F
MRHLTIDIEQLEQALDGYDSDDHYLDLQSGAILRVAPQDPSPGETSKSQVEPQRYQLIEALDVEERLAMRTDFLYSLDDPHAHRVLSHALDGRRPLKTFDYQLERFPSAHAAWKAHASLYLRELALGWLQEQGIEPGSGPALGDTSGIPRDILRRLLKGEAQRL